MALHGAVMVNETVIGYWSAVRQEGLTDPDAEYTYKWNYSQILEDGTTFTFHGEIKHIYSHLAPALIEKVMQAVTEQLSKFT